MLSGVTPVALDDSVSYATPIDFIPVEFDFYQVALGGSVQIDVLKNDIAVSSRLASDSLTITQGPAHGEAMVVERYFFGGYKQFTGFNGLANDNGSPVGNGFASALSGNVDAYGQIKLAVSSSAHNRLLYGKKTFEEGDYALYVRLAESNFSRFDPQVFDFTFRSRLDAPVDVTPQASSDHPQRFHRFSIPDQIPATPFIAWIDNTVGDGTPDTVLQNVGPYVIYYQPESGFVGTDTIRYIVRDANGQVSNEATVWVTVENRSPMANDKTVSTLRNTPVHIGDLGSDLDGTIEQEGLVLTTPPIHGTVEARETEEGQTWLYIPSETFSGTDVFRFQLQDDRGALSNIATVRVNVFNQAPMLSDDVTSVIANGSVVIDVLMNDFDTDGELDFGSLKIHSSAQHGITEILSTLTGPVVVYSPRTGYLGPDQFSYSVRDNDGFVAYATVVVNPAPVVLNDFASTTENFPIQIDVLANDVPGLASASINRSSLTIHSQPGRGRAVLRPTSNGPVVEYTPYQTTADQLVVDNLDDVDDGNYSPGQLSLREAIRLANADRYTDTFTYIVSDSLGVPSAPVTVTVDVLPGATTIRFSPTLYRKRKFTVPVKLVGDTEEGNSALVISSSISIVGNTGRKLMTIAGSGRWSDLRLFRVTHDGELDLQNMSLSRAATDGRGGAIFVESGGMATLTNCTVSHNFAFDSGGAIFNLGTVVISNSELVDNTAKFGGAITNFGQLTLNRSSVLRNRAGQGGGINNEYGTTTINSTSLSRNLASGRGGAFFDAGITVLVQSRLSGNKAEKGGGFFTVGQVNLIETILSTNRADTGGGFDIGSSTLMFTPMSEQSGTVTMNRTQVRHNNARHGGGFHSLGNVTITDSEISGNGAQQGGGFYLSKLSSPSLITVTNTTIDKNRATDGGGVYVNTGEIRLQRSTVSNNFAAALGGGILNNGFGWITNTTLGSNAAKEGGGLYNGFGHLVVMNSTIADNSAPEGGGIYNDVGFFTLQSSIVADNRYRRNASDVAGRTAADLESSRNNLIGSGGSGGLQNEVNDNIVGKVPLLSKLAHFGGSVATFSLLPGSPAINAGDGVSPDARNISPVGQRDIGAFESQGFIITMHSGSGQNANTNRRFPKPLRVLVTPIDPQEPVAGGMVSYEAPSFGAATETNPMQAQIGANGQASMRVTTNGIAGTYIVTANAAGIVEPTEFQLTNNGNSRVERNFLAASSSSPALTSSLTEPQFQHDTPLKAATSGKALTVINNSEYRLTRAQQLQQRSQGSAWTVVLNGVQKFEKGPNGDLYLLTNRHELKRLQFNSYWTTLQAGVRTFEMIPNGNLVVLDHLHRMFTYAFLDRYEVSSFDESSPNLLGVPSDAEVVRAANISSPGLVETILNGDLQCFGSFDECVDAIPDPDTPKKWFTNIRVVVELIDNRIESPESFQGIGTAQLHRENYKATIYADTAASGKKTVLIVFINHDHLLLMADNLAQSITEPSSENMPSNTALSNGTVTVSHGSEHTANTPIYGTVGHVAGTNVRESFAPRLVKGSDGTIYMMGVISVGQIGTTNSDPMPYNFWRLVPGQNWEELQEVRAIDVAPDGTLYALNAAHELQSLRPNTRRWVTLERNIQSFAMTPDGIVYGLNTDRELRQWSGASSSGRTLGTSVSGFAVLSDDTVFIHTDGQQFRRLVGGRWWITIAHGVTSFAQSDDTLYTLNKYGKLTLFEIGKRWQVLGFGVSSINVAFDGTLYAIDNRSNLKRLTSNDKLELLHTDVSSFQIAPNGDLYVLTDIQELKRLKSGFSWSLLQAQVQTYQIDQYGTVFVHDFLNRITMYSSYFLNVVEEPIDPGQPHFASIPPTDNDIVTDAAISGIGGQGLSMPDNLLNDVQYFPSGADDRYLFHLRDTVSSAWNNVRMVVEPYVDRVDPPRLIPNFGLAQLHHAQYKVTIYGETLIAHPASNPDNMFVNRNEVQVIYIDRDHLHLYQPGTAQIPSQTLDASAESVGNFTRSVSTTTRETAPGPAVQRQRDELAQSLTTAPNGTIYKLGGGQTGHAAIGSEPGPYFLWQLPPNGDWTPIDYVYSFDLGPDSQLYILDANRNLRTPQLGQENWTTLAQDVESFHITREGTLFVLNTNRELRTQLPGSSQWESSEQGIQSLMTTPNGDIYTINDQHELRMATRRNSWSAIDRGVQSFAMLSDGTLYFVNGKQQLFRMSIDQRQTRIAKDIQSIQIAPDGGVYALTSRRELAKLTSRDHWVVLEQSVDTFQIAPNGDLYLINDRHELRRQKLGYPWTTLQADVRSFKIYSDGTVYAVDSHEQLTLNNSSSTYFLSGAAGISDPPRQVLEGDVLAASNLYSASRRFDSAENVYWEVSDPYNLPTIVSRRDRQKRLALRNSSVVYPIPDQMTVENIRIVTEIVVDRLNPTRVINGIGPAQLREVQYKSTVTFNRPGNASDEQLVIYIDRDTVHLPSRPETM